MPMSSKHGGGVTQRLCTHTATTNNERVYAHIYTPNNATTAKGQTQEY